MDDTNISTSDTQRSCGPRLNSARRFRRRNIWIVCALISPAG